MVERYTSPTKTLSGLLYLEVANGKSILLMVLYILYYKK